MHDVIVPQKTKNIESTLRRLVEQADAMRERGELDVDSAECLIAEAISAITEILLGTGGAALAEVEPQNDREACCPICGRKTIKSKAD